MKRGFERSRIFHLESDGRSDPSIHFTALSGHRPVEVLKQVRIEEKGRDRPQLVLLMYLQYSLKSSG